MQGGMSAVTLPAGYLGSSIIGALLIFAGFDIVASKVASIVLGVCFLLTLWWARRDWLTIMTILLAVGLLVACWFIVHGEALRWVVVSHELGLTQKVYMYRLANRFTRQLFIGVMSALYSVWDIVSLHLTISPPTPELIFSCSVMILFSGKSTARMLVCLRRSTVAPLSAGVSSGPLFR